jgi:hypothetical protein
MRRVIIAAVLVLALAGCSPGADGKFLTDVGAAGVSQLDAAGSGDPGKTVGDAACADMKAGQAAANVAINVSNGKFTLPQAEIITYYAITDICPEQMSQRQEHWRNGS